MRKHYHIARKHLPSRSKQEPAVKGRLGFHKMETVVITKLQQLIDAAQTARCVLNERLPEMPAKSQRWLHMIEARDKLNTALDRLEEESQDIYRPIRAGG